MITIKGLSKTYPKAAVPALENLDLEVRPGEVFGFLGPNGAGKSTALRMITGILGPDRGSVAYDEVDLVRDPLTAKRCFGYVPDNPDLFLRLKAGEYLNFLGDVYGVPESLRKQRIEEYSTYWEIAENLKQSISSFSHGMRQKLLLVGSLIHDPKHWILDEPQVGLDPQASFRLKDLMRRRCESGHSVLFSTHILEVAEKICDRVGILSHGRLLFCGTLEELRSQSGNHALNLEELFLELTAQEST